MAEDGSVDRATVLYVLRANGVVVSLQPAPDQEMFLVVKGEISDVIPIPLRCGRKLLHNLSRKLDIPIFQFYNPLTAPPMTGEKVQ